MSLPHLDELKFKKTLLGFQLIQLVGLVVAGIGLAIIEFFFPSFFSYPYLKWSGLGSVLRFWPLFLWGIALAIFANLERTPIHISKKRELLGYSMATSVLAGLWEELGYRWIFICYAMISVIVANFIFGTVFGWIVTVAAIIMTFACLANKRLILAISSAALAGIGILMAFHADPIYWLYQYAVIPVIHLVTFHQLGSILYGEYGKTFLFGAILANTWFRDGHKYQGTFGVVNSWYAGMVLLYATLTYSLWTAIIIHALYDIGFDVVRFVMTRSQREPTKFRRWKEGIY